MLRPQVFALQQGEAGEPSIGFAASEKQAIDAALQSLAESDGRFWTRPDLIWNARGGSHTDGGAFLFNVVRGPDGAAELQCRDKFGRQIKIDEASVPYRGKIRINGRSATANDEGFPSIAKKLRSWRYADLQDYLSGLLSGERNRKEQLELLTQLLDRRYETGQMRRSSVLTILDQALAEWLDAVRKDPNAQFIHHARGMALPEFKGQIVAIDAAAFAAQGSQSLALEIGTLIDRGFRKLVVMNAKGQRFIANGLGGNTGDIRIDVYGSSGDYLASGIDGAQVIVHGSGQDQLAQIMKSGKLVVHGDVGQTFMYGAKGGEAYILGNAAGRPLINAVGKPRVVINGTCLDYLAESFMAGDPLSDGGFVVLNGIAFNGGGQPIDLDTPYPGGNLFSLASGGAIFLRDPDRVVGDDQLNGGEFSQMTSAHWDLVLPLLEENERLFGIKVSRLLSHKGKPTSPEAVYRLIVPAKLEALQPEQAWVQH
jgi:glutamate synthase domain-containing protein 3